MAAKGVKRLASRQFVKIVKALLKAPEQTMTREKLLADLTGSGWVAERLSTYLWNARKAGYSISTKGEGRGKVEYILAPLTAEQIAALDPPPVAAPAAAPADGAAAPPVTASPPAPPAVAKTDPATPKKPTKAEQRAAAKEAKLKAAGGAAAKAAPKKPETPKLTPETKKSMDKIADEEIPAHLRRA